MFKGKVIRDWDTIDFSQASQRQQFIGAVSHFLGIPGSDEVVKAITSRAAIQHYTMTGDFPTEVNEIIDRFHLTPVADEQWRTLFDVRDYTNTKATGFRLMNVGTGLTFRKLKDTEEIEVKKISGAEVEVLFDRYGGALGWTRTWFDDARWWDLEDTLTEFRNQAFDSRASIYWALIEAIGSGQNVAWQNPVPASLANTDANYTAVRDAETINKACETIILALEGLGMGVDVSTSLVLTAPLQLKQRILRAMGLANAGLSGNLQGVNYNVTVQFTTKFATTTQYYVCVPKLKNKAGIRMELSLFGAFHNLSYSEDLAGYMRHGGAIGAVAQWARCLTS